VNQGKGAKKGVDGSMRYKMEESEASS
jgi:hypothetical protein